MKIRSMLLLFTAVILFTATSAMACEHCTVIGNRCRTSPLMGFTDCVDDIDVGCILSGDPCGGAISSEQPLASEYSVAVVERIDQAQPPAKEPLVAPSETEASPSR